MGRLGSARAGRSRRMLARNVIEVYEARFGAMPAEVRAMIEGTQVEATLRPWLKLAATRSAEEIAAAVHAARAS